MIASACVLAYERPEFLHETIESLLSTDAGMPIEVVIHNDGSGGEVFDYLMHLAHDRKVSMVINNCGKNMGIEKAMKRCVACCSGDFIFKLDTDLTFKEGWAEKAVELLQDPSVGPVGLLDYRNYDPSDKRFHNVTDHGNYLESDNLVSSAYGFRREVFEKHGEAMKHDGWHKYLVKQGYRLLITKPDMVTNFGFGRSIYVGEDGKAVNMDNPPKTF